MRLVKAGNVARTTFSIIGLDGKPITGLTHGTGWQAKYRIASGSITLITAADGGENSDGEYYADLTTSTAGDDIKFWATYTSSGVSLMAPAEPVLVVNYDPSLSPLSTPANKLYTDANGKVVLSPVIQSGAVIPTVSTLSDKTGFSLSAAGITAIWAALTSGITTVGSIGKWILDKLDVVLSTRATPGDEMDLVDSPNQTARDAIATTVESHLLDEGDSQMLINAIVGAIGNQNIDQSVLIAAIRADLERTGGNLATIITNLALKLNATDYTAPDNASAAAAATSASANNTLLADATNGLAAIKSAISGGSAIGSGADQCTQTITIDGNPVADADVWITSDSAGTTIVAGTLQTDSNGEVVFMLDAGSTYYLWMQKDGVNSIRGQQFTAVSD